MKLGIIGTGNIVHEALYAMDGIIEIEKKAIYARPHSRQKAEDLARKYRISQVYTDYDELLEKAGLDCVYIGLVNSAHCTYARKALEAGLHVILEKPLVSTVKEAEELAALARSKGLFCLEAITTLHSKVFKKMQEILPKLGRLKVIQCNFSQYSSKYKQYLQGEVAPAFDPALSGGALYDINLYNIYLVTGLLGEPKDALYFPNLGFNGIDTSGMAVLSYEDCHAACTGAKDSDSPSFAIFQGEDGWMRMVGKPNVMEGLEFQFADDSKPLEPNAAGGMSRAMTAGTYMDTDRRHRMPREFVDFARIIDTRNAKEADDYLEKSLTVMRTLEKARKAAGISFPADQAEAF